ncbi:hypothetical protein LBMAG27_25550 [Bacteroidota bacterium]|nr:hypothetical protein LBMAG27_25550 [Bacteroidota bacterium]
MVSLNNTKAQICTFAGEECCGEGITNFQLNGTPAINRTSTVNENGGFTNTAVTATVIKGQAYNYSVTFPIEDNIVNCNTFNFKIYIDYNQNDLLTDAGEEVASLSSVANGTYTGTFTIPTSAATGNAYMRVMMKMASTSLSGGFCGHTDITPCNIPADPVGFHGEVENYTLNITGASGLTNITSGVNDFQVYPNPANDDIIIDLPPLCMNCQLEISNTLGQVLYSEFTDQKSKTINLQFLKQGVYFVTLKNEYWNEVKRIVKQ